MRQFLKDEFIQFGTLFSAHQCDPNTSISFTVIYFSLLALYGQIHTRIYTIFTPPFAFLSTLLPFLQGPAFVIPELLFSRCFVGYAHLRSTAARFKNAALLAEGVM